MYEGIKSSKNKIKKHTTYWEALIRTIYLQNSIKYVPYGELLPTIKIFELFGWMPSTLSKNKFGMCVRGEGVLLRIRIMYFKNNVFLHLVTSIFQQVHQLLGQLLPAILGSYCYCCHVSMPGFILSFNFTHNCSKSIVLFKIKSKQFNYLYSEHCNRRKIM